jgi:ferrous-iron efflux pump FieF
MGTLTAEQRAQEGSVLVPLSIDWAFLAPYLAVGLLSGSLTMIAVSVRWFLILSFQTFSFIVMRRINRGKLADLEFGTGKLEQFCNLAMATGMILGAILLARGAVDLAIQGHTDATPLGLTSAAVFNAANVLVNFVAWHEIRRTAGPAPPVIVLAQLQKRLTVFTSSCIEQVTMTVAAIARDPVIAAYADSSGALFVVGYVTVTAIGMLRAGLPDLLDRSVDEASQIAVLRSLAHHYLDYDRLDHIRSRRSGKLVFVEIGLGFDAGLPLREVDRRAAAIKETIAREIEGADVSILVSAHPPPPATLSERSIAPPVDEPVATDVGFVER